MTQAGAGPHCSTAPPLLQGWGRLVRVWRQVIMLMLGEMEEGTVMVMEAETVMVAVLLLLLCGAVAVLRPPLVARSAGHQSHGAHRPDHTRGRTEDRLYRALNEIPKHSEKTPCRAITLLDRSTN